jgi:ZIP family zinc transporter
MPLLYTIVPVCLAVLGAVFATQRNPSAVFTSAVQHLAAGVVFAAAACEILPDILHKADPLPTLAGGLAGVAAMLAVRKGEALAKGPLGMLAAIGVDILIDGLVLGLGFSADARTGLLLTAALSLELLLLGLTSAVSLGDIAGTALRKVTAVAGLALLLPAGVLLASPAAELPQQANLALLSFGLIALLYLVTEELLVEAHEVKEKNWVTALFFAGFLALLLLDELMG